MVEPQNRGKNIMSPNDLVFNETYKGCLKAGCNERLAKDTAISTLQKYKKGQFSKASKLISESITDAKKLIVKKRK